VPPVTAPEQATHVTTPPSRRLGGAVLAVPLLLAAPTAAAAAPTDPDVLAGASGYLVDQLDPDTQLVENEEFGFTDQGLTADVVLALTATGGDPDQVAATVAALTTAEQVDTYVSGGSATERYAGSFAKLALTVQATGGDPTDVAGRDLLAELAELTQAADADQPGRISDVSEFGDFSSVITQSLAILAFSAAEQDLPERSLDFLLDDQCETGGFTNEFGDAPGCVGDPDATGFAVQALLAAGANEADAALAWLESIRTEEGAWVSDDLSGDPVANANSTGLASQAFTAAGSDTEASRAFLVSLQDDQTCGFRYQASDPDADARATVQAVPALTEAPFLALADGSFTPAELGTDPCAEADDPSDDPGDDPGDDSGDDPGDDPTDDPVDGDPVDGDPVDGGPVDGGPVDGDPTDGGVGSGTDRTTGSTVRTGQQTPTTTVTSDTLPRTGTDGLAGLVAGGVLALLLGAVTLTRTRRTGDVT
jgi:hypothetical protein